MHRGRGRGVCFVAPSAYPILAGDRRIRFIGGAEVQQCLLARGLAERGHRVTMVCMDFGQPEIETIAGVDVVRAHAPDAGLPVIRFVHPRLTSLMSAMKRADADVYYQRTSASLTAFVVAFGRIANRASVYAAASDAEFDPRLPAIPIARDRALFRWGVRRADAVVTQNPAQVEGFARVHGRESTLIGSCYRAEGGAARHDGAVLWVGSVRANKGPLDLIELARRCPDLRFRVVGDGDASLMQRLREAATSLGNLEIAGFVPFADVESQFDGAFALVNTSPAEGFPNTFLQAWSRGIPTAAYIGTAARVGGRPVGSQLAGVDAMAERLREWKAREDLWSAAGHDARTYAADAFPVDRALDAYEAVFERIAPGWSKPADRSA